MAAFAPEPTRNLAQPLSASHPHHSRPRFVRRATKYACHLLKALRQTRFFLRNRDADRNESVTSRMETGSAPQCLVPPSISFRWLSWLNRGQSDYMDSSYPNLTHDLAVRMAELARVMAAPRTLEPDTRRCDRGSGASSYRELDVSGVLLVKKGGDFESLADTAGVAAAPRQAAARLRRRALL